MGHNEDWIPEYRRNGLFLVKGKIKHKAFTDVSIGHSQITKPFKGAIKKFNHNRKGMFVKEINTKIIKDAESSYKIKKDIIQK